MTSPAAHFLWFLITAVTFGAGWMWQQGYRKAERQTRASGAGATILTDAYGRGTTPAGGQQTSNAGSPGSHQEIPKRTALSPTGKTLARPTPGSETFAPLTKEQILELVQTSIQSTDPLERRRAFDRLLREVGSKDFTVEQAMAMRSAMGQNGASGEQWQLFDYAWGANHPEEAIAHRDDIPERYLNDFTSSMLPGLASTHPQMAIELVNRLDESLHNRMTGQLLKGLADYDLGYATDYVQQLNRDGHPNTAWHMRTLAGQVMDSGGLDAGRSWAEGLQEGPLQAAALVKVANEFANQDPPAAAQWAEQFLQEDQNSRLFGEVVREWKNPEAAAQWVESLEPSLGQRDALSAVYGFRGAMQPQEALQDIMAMPESADKNFALNGFISGLAHQDGEAAVLWAAEITDPGMRQAAMVRAGTQYFRQDHGAASEWFVSSGLPEGTLNQMARSR
ncbi:MAG: hypothetical protein AAF514_00505 [Verrucomicrobiota bacterium]